METAFLARETDPLGCARGPMTLAVSEQVHNHFRRYEVEYLQFAFRWMNNLLMRELPLRCTIRLWDTYQVRGDPPPPPAPPSPGRPSAQPRAAQGSEVPPFLPSPVSAIASGVGRLHLTEGLDLRAWSQLWVRTCRPDSVFPFPVRTRRVLPLSSLRVCSFLDQVEERDLGRGGLSGEWPGPQPGLRGSVRVGVTPRVGPCG